MSQPTSSKHGPSPSQSPSQPSSLTLMRKAILLLRSSQLKLPLLVEEVARLFSTLAKQPSSQREAQVLLLYSTVSQMTQTLESLSSQLRSVRSGLGKPSTTSGKQP